MSVPRILFVSLLCAGFWGFGVFPAVALLEEMGQGAEVLQGMAGGPRTVAAALLAWSLPGAAALIGLVVAVRAVHRSPFRQVLAFPVKWRRLGRWLAGGVGGVAVAAAGMSLLGRMDAGNLAGAVALLAGFALAVEAVSTEAVRAYLVRGAVASAPPGWPSAVAGAAATAVPGTWLLLVVATVPDASMHPAYSVAVVLAMGLGPGLFTLVDGRVERAIAWAVTTRLAAGAAAVGGATASPLLAGGAAAVALAVLVAVTVVEGWTLRGVARTLMQAPGARSASARSASAQSASARSGTAPERDEEARTSTASDPEKAAVAADDEPEDSPHADRAAPPDADAASRTCANCGSSATGQYCATCGQQQSYPMTMFAFLRRSLAEVVDLDGRMLRTIRDYVPPGTVTKQYLAGKRRRYIRPVRLYLAMSFVFFILLAYATPEEPIASGDEPGVPTDTVTVERSTYDRLVAASNTSGKAVAGTTRTGTPPGVPSGDTPSGDTPSGDTPSGDTPSGDTPPGDTPPGDTPPGDTPPGDTPPGDTPPGDTPPGDTPPGDTPPGDTTPDTLDAPRTHEAPSDTSTVSSGPSEPVRLAPVRAESRANRALKVVLQNAAQVMFVLVPLFAFLLQVVFLNYTYVQHLIFTLHAHVFGFVVVSGAPLLELFVEGGTDVEVGGTPIAGLYAIGATLGTIGYVWGAMRTVYGVGWMRGLFVTLALMFIYAVAFVVVLGFAVGIIGSVITS